MSYPEQFNGFLEQKNSFFRAPLTLNSIDDLASSASYSILFDNRVLIEEEIEDLYDMLDNLSGENAAYFWSWAYYCCSLLENYYRTYGAKLEQEKYAGMRLKLSEYFSSIRCVETPKSFMQTLKKSLKEGISDLAHFPFHISKIKDKVGFLNVCRIYWTFCRLTITNGFLLAKDAQWISQLNKLLGKNIDVDKIIQTLEKPNPVFRALSVGFFGARIMLNVGTLLKHTFNPDPLEKIVWYKRIGGELIPRHPEYLNDFIWGTVNGITNYAQVFHLSAPLAAWITAGFLIFDISLLFWCKHLANEKFRTKQAQYHREWEACQKNSSHSLLSRDRALVIRMQMDNRQDKHDAINATFWFNIGAAFLLIAGFTASLILASAALVVASYMVCTIGVAMYLAAPVFRRYIEASLKLKRKELNEEDSTRAQAEYNAARSQFVYTMVRNILVPGVFIVTFAVCWEAALVLTALYMAFEITRLTVDFVMKYKNSKSVPVEPESDSLSEEFRDPSEFNTNWPEPGFCSNPSLANFNSF